MEVFLEILYRFGLPTALLLLLAWERFHTVKKKDAQIAAMSIAHAKRLATLVAGHSTMITALAKDKDDELKRVNEARVADQASSTDRSIRVATEFTETAGDHNKTMSLLVDRFSAMTTAVDRLERTMAK